jgi:hypothetical protein
MRTFIHAPKLPRRSTFAESAAPGRAPLEQSREVNSILPLQHAIGNQAVQRMLQTHAEEIKAGVTPAALPLFGQDFGGIPIHVSAPGAIQTKLAINQPGDEYEQEADRISEHVMRMPEAQLQPAYDYGGTRPRGQTEQPVQNQERLQTKRAGSGGLGPAAAPSIVHEVLRSPGQPLDPATRAFMEPRFGHDFNHVRIHTDEKASDSALAVNALAYTSGRHLVFGAGQYSPTTASGRRLLVHELVHSVQQGFAENSLPEQVGDSGRALQRKEDSDAPSIDFHGSPEVGSMHVVYSAYEGDDLRNNLGELADKNVKNYGTYRDAISKSNPIEKRAALNTELLSALSKTLDALSFARCVELLGRRAPTFDELRKNSVVHQAIEDAWKASDPGTHGDLVTRPHEEGGWVFMNLIDGSLSITRARAEGTNFIKLETPPDVADSVVVAVFHTHPTLGPGAKAKPSRPDKVSDERAGVPDLVAGNTGTNPDVFQIYLSGPAVRKHLGSETKFPGRSGGIAP